MIPAWVAEFMGIPFIDHGRSAKGCDCYGLARLVLAERFGVSLPELTAGYSSTCNRAEIARLIDHQRPLLDLTAVAEPRPGDLVHIRQFGAGCHVGVMVTSHLMLHTEAPAGPRCDDIRRPHLRPRILGFYRHD